MIIHIGGQIPLTWITDFDYIFWSRGMKFSWGAQNMPRNNYCLLLRDFCNLRALFRPVLWVGTISILKCFWLRWPKMAPLSLNQKYPSIFVVLFCFLGTVQSARSSGAPLLKSHRSPLVLPTVQHSRVSTEVQIKLEIKTTLICILNQSGIFPVCFEGKI